MAIGKSHALAEFSTRDMPVIVVNKIVRLHYTHAFQCDNVYTVDELIYRNTHWRGSKIKKVIVDEGVDFSQIPLDIEVVTGFYSTNY